jgi:hypothetical protein
MNTTTSSMKGFKARTQLRAGCNTYTYPAEGQTQFLGCKDRCYEDNMCRLGYESDKKVKELSASEKTWFLEHFNGCSSYWCNPMLTSPYPRGSYEQSCKNIAAKPKNNAWVNGITLEALCRDDPRKPWLQNFKDINYSENFTDIKTNDGFLYLVTR